MEGTDTSAMQKTWEELAATEMRLQLMNELLRINVGLADVEEFNLNLKGNLKNQPSEKFSEMHDIRFVRAAMNIKMYDEQVTRGKLIRCRNKCRTQLMMKLGRNTKKYRTVIKSLRRDAQAIKTSYRKFYDDKMEHLRCKYRESEEEKVDKIPTEMQELITLSIFDRENLMRLPVLVK